MAFYTDEVITALPTAAGQNSYSVVCNKIMETFTKNFGGYIARMVTVTANINTTNYGEYIFPNGTIIRATGIANNIINFYFYTPSLAVIGSLWRIQFVMIGNQFGNGGQFTVRKFKTSSGTVLLFSRGTGQMLLGYMPALDLVTNSQRIVIVQGARTVSTELLTLNSTSAGDATLQIQLLTPAIYTSSATREVLLVNGIFTSSAYVFDSVYNIFSLGGRYFLYLGSNQSIEISR